MKKYYFGFIALAILTIGAIAITLAHANDGKRDDETSKKVDTISTELTSYLYQQNKIPVTLGEAGISNVPSTISYQKLDNERFKFCAYYDHSSSSFDAGPLAFITGLVFNAPAVDNSSNDEKTYLDGYSLSFVHKKGNNCQTVKPMLATPQTFQ